MRNKITHLSGFYCFIALLLTLSQFAGAVPAPPYPVSYTLPDSSTITIQLHGDEFAHWASSSDDYTLLHNAAGFYEYAVKDARGDLVASGMRAKNIAERTVAEHAFLQQTPRNLKFSATQISMMQQLRQTRDNAMRSYSAQAGDTAPTTTPQHAPVVGVVHAPLILVDFPGKPFTRTQADFQALMNNVNYTATSDGAITGSVHDYFLASSYNQLNFQVDVFGPFTMSHSIAYYDETSNGDPSQMAREAAIAADAAGCNFANYDVNNDGIVDGIHIIFAGYGQEAGAPVGQSIWSHAWAVYGTQLRLDNKRISSYSCSPELRNSSGTSMTYIGVIAHELSHVFGLPDLYDTDYANSGGQAVHLDQWDIMASGSWNDNGRTPALHSAYCRDLLGWVTAVELDNTPADIVLPNPALQTQGVAYKVNTNTPREYFLLENRQKQGWDTFIPASGLLIYHVDSNYIAIAGNSINANPTHRGLYVKQAGGGANSTNGNRTIDPYPQGSNNSFTDSSTPNAKSWAGANTIRPITDITHNTANRTVSFKFLGGEGFLLTVDIDSIVLNADSVYDVNFTCQGDFQSGNIFKVQLSDKWGYFESPTDIGTLNFAYSDLQNPFNGTISVTIPSNIEPGSEYRIRLQSTNLALVSNDNGTDISINNPFYIDPFVTAIHANGSIELDFVQSYPYAWVVDEVNGYVKSSNQGVNISISSFTSSVSNAYGTEISFQHFVSSENNYDFLNFYVDNVSKIHASGTSQTNFALFSQTLSPGTHTLKWEFTKDQYAEEGADEARVKELKVVYLNDDLTLSVTEDALEADSTYNVTFNGSGEFASDNVFNIELSDKFGSF
ncbi:MAG: M6 family metalloprotease domain-containing protein, partial [Paludibacter sp.]|nr:M6 family metalloprotease domain-containing protein [Paludibacter sp.]